ncbi:MAG: autotransporter-associated beta strand repeat-containing protein [Pseudomonadota bacterium]
MKHHIPCFMLKQRLNSKNYAHSNTSITHSNSAVFPTYVNLIILVAILFNNISSINAAKDNLYNVTTFAGSGKAGSTDGTGTAASFNSPGNLTIDSHNNLYVSDWNNYVIRKITSNGVVTTFAGLAGKSGNTNGTGTAAQFNAVRGITCDSTSSNLYVADMGNGLIRKIDISTAAVTNFVNFGEPYAIAAQDSTYLYVISHNYSSIYRTSYSSPGARAFAGNGDYPGYVDSADGDVRFLHPSGIIMSGGNLYITDSGNNCIRKMTASGFVTTIAGGGGISRTAPGSTNGLGTAATFNRPTGITVDSSGNLYVADQGNNLIRKMTTAGVVTTIAGGGGIGRTAPGSANGLGTAATFRDLCDLVVDSNGNIYVTDIVNNIIRLITPNYIGAGYTDTVLASTDYGTYESIHLAGGTMQVSTSNLTVANKVALTANTTNIINTTTTRGYNFTLSNIVSGTGALTLTGNNTVILSGVNTYTGSTNIEIGTTLIGNIATSAGVSVKGIYDLNGTAQALIDLNGTGTIQSSGGTPAALTIISQTGSTFAGIITNSISGITLNGNKTLTLSGANTYTGPTLISTGSTLIGNIATSVGATISGTYDLKGTARTLIDPSGAGTIQSSGSNAALTIISQNGSTFTGTLADSIGGLILNGPNTFTFSGATVYAGPVTVSSGTLALTNARALSGAINLSQNTTLKISTTDAATFVNPITFTSNTPSTPIARINVSQPTTFSGPITCVAPAGTTGALIISGGYPVTLTGAQIGSFTIILSGKNTRLTTSDPSNSAKTLLTEHQWFHFNS